MQPNLRELFAQVRNRSDHSDTIGVYMDVIPPGGVTNPFGCLPTGRIILTSVFLTAFGTAGDDANVFADTGSLGDGQVEFSCTDRAGALGKTYTIIAAADLHNDDLASCGAGALQSLACFNALADDDQDPPDNRKVRNAPKVQ